MSTIPVRRPLGCLKSVLRQSRQQKQQQRRGYANAIFKEPAQIPPVPPTPAPKIYPIVNKAHRAHHPYAAVEAPRYRSAYAVYTTPTTAVPHLRLSSPTGPTHPHLKRASPDPIAAHHAYQIRKMDPTGARTRLFAKDNQDCARMGDVLLVSTKRAAEPFAGVLMAVRRRGIETAILLRNHLTKIGVEMWFKLYSRSVTGIEIIQRAPKRARRAKLTYLRHPKHDMGNVDHLVRLWRRNRLATTSKAGGKRKKAPVKKEF